jgi:hypothetical protein
MVTPTGGVIVSENPQKNVTFDKANSRRCTRRLSVPLYLPNATGHSDNGLFDKAYIAHSPYVAGYRAAALGGRTSSV